MVTKGVEREASKVEIYTESIKFVNPIFIGLRVRNHFLLEVRF